MHTLTADPSKVIQTAQLFLKKKRRLEYGSLVRRAYVARR